MLFKIFFWHFFFIFLNECATSQEYSVKILSRSEQK